MKALTIRQPHASLVAAGAKTIETRSWPTKYRGPLLTHAGKAIPERGDYGEWYVDQADIHVSPPRIAPAQPTTPGWGRSTELEFSHREWGMADDRGQGLYYPLPLGAVVASCQLIDCVPIIAFDAAAEDRYVSFLPEPHRPNELVLRRDPAEALEMVTDQLPFGDFSPGRYAWLLGDVQAIAPVPMRGRQGLWNPTAEECAQLSLLDTGTRGER